MLHDCVDYQQLTQFNARIDAINASIYAGSGVFLACFWHVSALRAELLCMCIAKCVHMVEMHYILTYIPLTFLASLVRYNLLICVNRFSIGSAFPLQRRLINLIME